MLRWRLLSGITLAVLVTLALVWGGWPGAALFSALSVWMAWTASREFFRMTRGCGVPGFPGLTSAFAVLLILAAGLLPVLLTPSLRLQFVVTDLLQVALFTAFLALAFRRVFRRGPGREAVLDLLVSCGGLLYVVWTLSFIPRIYFNNGLQMDGRWLVVFLIAVTKASDIGAYTVGMLTAQLLPGGNHKMMPLVSPKKSWEGFCGGLAASIGVALALVYYWPSLFHFNGERVLGLTSAVVWGALAATLGFWGDVAESALKRAGGVKDSGYIPGLGGVLDVVDSLMLVAPPFYAWLQYTTA